VSLTVDVSPNIDAYFEEIVHEAIVARQVEATRAAEHYLVGLLSDYARGHKPSDALDQPLTLQLHEALGRVGAERFQRLRELGDGVLYLVGFFGGSLTRRGADPEYVISVGSSAYGHASAMLRMGGSDASHDVLSEMSHKFHGFVAVLCEIADGALGRASSDEAIVELYERWQATGSARLSRALASLGVCPVRSSGGVH
jgi:hypothetical protein